MTLDPKQLFELVAKHVPEELHEHILIVGSLAVAYHYRADLEAQAVNTKDADVVVQPAGAIDEAQSIAQCLLDNGWRRHPSKCFPKENPNPADELRAVRLLPPDADSYYIELLGLPLDTQAERLRWEPVELSDGWYGLPCFRYMALAAFKSEHPHLGIRYAAPRFSALANLLSHMELGDETMSEPIGDRRLRRCAKDLGRVLAIAWLAGADEIQTWPSAWAEALHAKFPDEAQELAASAGDGLRALLEDEDLLEEAKHANNVSLLRGKSVGAEQLRATGEQLISFTLDPLASLAEAEES